MKAVIVAAGRSSRLYPLTESTPKSLLQIGRTSLIERWGALLREVGVEDVVVVVGYHHEKLRAALRDQARFVLNPFYEQTNNMASLWLAMPYLGNSPFIYLHSDVIYHTALLHRVATDPSGAEIQLLVDFESVDDEAMKVRTAHGRFAESSKAIPRTEAAGEWIGLAQITAAASTALHTSIETLLAAQHFQAYDTAAFNALAAQGTRFGLIATDGLPWCEIDTPHDLQRARSLFGDEPC